MISEGSCDIEVWSNDAENPASQKKNKSKSNFELQAKEVKHFICGRIWVFFFLCVY